MKRLICSKTKVSIETNYEAIAKVQARNNIVLDVNVSNGGGKNEYVYWTAKIEMIEFTVSLDVR